MDGGSLKLLKITQEKDVTIAELKQKLMAAEARLTALFAPVRLDEREFAGDAVTAWRAYHDANDRASQAEKVLATVLCCPRCSTPLKYDKVRWVILCEKCRARWDDFRPLSMNDARVF